MTKYVLGFLFNESGEILLIMKNRPSFLKGTVNGVGGKVEADEDALGSLIREYREETGLDVSGATWINFASMIFEDADIECFCAHKYDFCEYQILTDEAVFIANSLSYKVMKHPEYLPILIEMARSPLIYQRKIELPIKIKYFGIDR